MLLDFTENWGKIKFMKKLLGILVLGLLWGNISFADRLGISEKKLDINFNCTIAEDFMLKAGFPIEAIESAKKKHNNLNFGYKEYNHPEDDFILIHLEYNNNKNEYSFPDSIATRWKSEKKSIKFYYTSYLYGSGFLIEYVNNYIGGEDFLLFKYSYKVDEKNTKKYLDLRKSIFVDALKSPLFDQERFSKSFFKVLEEITN